MKSTVLIVDDDPVTRKCLSTRLSSEGFRILEAANGREALSVLEDQTPSLILIDMHMPVMDGWKLVQAIRCYEELAHIPVVMMSEGELPETRLPVMRKPIDHDLAVETLRFTLRGRVTAAA
jgi:CheY-like chemotaxis protein